MNHAAKRTVLVTGASSGIGNALVKMFAARDCRVIAVARRASSLQHLAAWVEREGGKCLPLVMDVSNDKSVAAGFRFLQQRRLRIDILVNNAGITSFKEFLKTPVAEFDAIMATNLRSLFQLTKRVLPGMIRGKAGSIVNVLSFAAKTVYPNSAVYAASKAGGEAMMNVLRAEARGDNIRVINVFPGAVATPMWSKSMRSKYRNVMLNPDDVAALIVDATLRPGNGMLEEIIIRPQIGDLVV